MNRTFVVWMFLIGILPAGTVVAEETAPLARWDGVPSGQFRSWVIDRGEFIYSNGIFQSRGANTDGLVHEDYIGFLDAGPALPRDERDDVDRQFTWGAFGVDRYMTDGDYELPRDPENYPDFTGELAELRMKRQGNDLAVRFRFTSMPAPDAQIATLTFRAEDAATELAEWPAGAGVRSGWKVALTTWGTGAILTADDGSQTELPGTAVQVDTTLHTVEVLIPLRDLPGGPWVLTGGAGLADPADRSRYWQVPAGSATASSPGSGSSTRSGPAVFSLLFADDAQWVFTARTESMVLLDGDVSAQSVTVDPRDLVPGKSVQPSAQYGRLARFYESRGDFGDGIAKADGPPEPFPLPPEVPGDEAALSFEYLGALQPYGMLVPEAYGEGSEPWPLILYLHGLNNFYYEPFGVLPNLDEEVRRHGYLFAGLLGRGDLSYRGRGELDVLEVLADIRRHYNVDPDRIYLMGHSMGSIGTHNVATRNPDVFAAVSPSQIAAAVELMPNLRHIPYQLVAGQADFLDEFGEGSQAGYDTMSALGYDAVFYRYLDKTHEASATYDSLPQTLALFDRSRRVTQPAEIIYRRLPDDDHPALGLVHDGAYAIDAMIFADQTRPQQVMLRSLAIPHQPLQAAQALRTTNQLVDEGGPSGRTNALKSVTQPVFGPAEAVRNELLLALENVASLQLEAARLGLTAKDTLVLHSQSETETMLRLIGLDGDGDRILVRDGREDSVIEIQDGEVLVPLPVGVSVLELRLPGAEN